MMTSRTVSRLVLASLGVLLVVGLWRPLPRHGASLAPDRTDSALYRAVIERVARGEGYHAALNQELRARNYPTASVFNWRFPTLISALASAPVMMRIGLAGMTVAVIALTARLFQKSAPEVMLLAVLAQVGATVSAFTPLAIVLHESWAGTCLALSALLYARGCSLAGAGFGIAALFFRELAAPYAVICVCLAVRARRRGELAAWAGGGVLFAGLYLLHARSALHYIQPGDLAHPSWLQFGGVRFALATIGFAGWLYVLPAWVAAFAMVLLAASPWSPLRAFHAKATGLTYVILFMIIGQPFNQSWGAAGRSAVGNRVRVGRRRPRRVDEARNGNAAAHTPGALSAAAVSCLCECLPPRSSTPAMGWPVWCCC